MSASSPTSCCSSRAKMLAKLASFPGRLSCPSYRLGKQCLSIKNKIAFHIYMNGYLHQSKTIILCCQSG
jgi:hypothetical protein